MAIKNTYTWNSSDYSTMSWNNCRLYGWILPGKTNRFKMAVDYCLRSPITDRDFGRWELIPVELVFEEVIDLQIHIDMKNFTEIDIIDLSRMNERPSPNRKRVYHDYLLELSGGSRIAFTASGFEQRSVSVPIVSDSYELCRDEQNVFLQHEQPLQQGR